MFLLKNISEYFAKEYLLKSISGLATTSALTDVENKIPNVSNLTKKIDYDTNLMKLKRRLLIISMTNISLRQNLIS